METLDQQEVTRKPGRPRREDTTSPLHDHRVKEAERLKEMRKEQDVLDEYYTLVFDKHKKGAKIVYCKKTATGTTRQYVGREKDNLSFVEKIKKEGKLKT